VSASLRPAHPRRIGDRLLPRAGFIAAALAAAAIFPGAQGAAAATAGPSGHYVVEFHARPGGVFGHTFVVYGRVDAGGRLRHARDVGFYPDGVLSQTILLAVLATPASVGAERSDKTYRSDIVYRREINADTYARLTSEVRTLRRERPFWQLILYNCNSFAGEIAQWLGMRVPPTLQLPKDFVRGLYVLNRRNAPQFAHAEAMSGDRVLQGPDMLFLQAVRGGAVDR
jgi:hypothetical protein